MPVATAQKCRRGRGEESVVVRRHPFLTSVELEGHSQTPSYRRNRLGGSVVIAVIHHEAYLDNLATMQVAQERGLQIGKCDWSKAPSEKYARCDISVFDCANERSEDC